MRDQNLAFMLTPSIKQSDYGHIVLYLFKRYAHRF